MLRAVEQEVSWMYETIHTDGKTKGRIEDTIWSEVFSCPQCAGEIVFLDELTTGLDPQARRATWELVAAIRDRDVVFVRDGDVEGKGGQGESEEEKGSGFHGVGDNVLSPCILCVECQVVKMRFAA